MHQWRRILFSSVLTATLLWLSYQATPFIQPHDETSAAFSHQTVVLSQANTDTELSKLLLQRLGKQGIIGVRDLAYAPDGKTIAFVGEFEDTWAFVDIQTPRPKTDLWLSKGDGTSLRRLSNNGKSYDPHWSPSGKEIVFVSEGSVRILSLQTGQQKLLSGLAGDRRYAWECDYHEFIQPRWSPNGKLITAISENGCRGGRVVVIESKRGRKLFEYETRDYKWTEENDLILAGCGRIRIAWNSIGVLGMAPAPPLSGNLKDNFRMVRRNKLTGAKAGAPPHPLRWTPKRVS